MLEPLAFVRAERHAQRVNDTRGNGVLDREVVLRFLIERAPTGREPEATTRRAAARQRSESSPSPGAPRWTAVLSLRTGRRRRASSPWRRSRKRRLLLDDATGAATQEAAIGREKPLAERHSKRVKHGWIVYFTCSVSMCLTRALTRSLTDAVLPLAAKTSPHTGMSGPPCPRTAGLRPSII